MVDTQKSIGNVRKRVSALGDGSTDRSVLARSVLASRSLLDRSNDVERLLHGLRVPFRTAPDHRIPANDQLMDLNAAGAELFSRWKKKRPNADRSGAHGSSPARQISMSSAVAGPNVIRDPTISDGQRNSLTQRIDTDTQSAADPSGTAARPSRGIDDDDRPGNTNTSASPSDLQAEKPPQTLQGAEGNPSEAPASVAEELEPDAVIRRSAQRVSIVQDDTRVSTEPTETGIQEATDVMTQEAGTSGEKTRPIVIISVVRWCY